jgi:ATP-dependent RNA helicase DDX60
MARTLPPDFALEARDCLSLYEELRKLADSAALTDALQADLALIDPSRFFDPRVFLKQKEIIRYEKALKEVLSKLIESPRSHDEHSSLQTIVRGLTDPEIAKTPEELLLIAPKRAQLEGNLLELISDLHVEGDLVGDRCSTLQ